MKNTTFTLLLSLAALTSAAVSETHITAAEWAVVTANNDPWSCPLRSIEHYLTAGPSPTGALESALNSYEGKLFAVCSSTYTIAPTAEFQPCPVPPRRTLCAFSAAIPTSLLPAYSSFASSAASWWSAGNGDEVVSLVKECPYLWYESLLMNPGKGMTLNRTVEHAQCWAEAHPTGAGGGSGTSMSTKASTGSGVTGSTPKSTPTPTPTPKATGNGGVRGRAGVVSDNWMMAGSGVGVAAAMNIGLL